MTREQALVEAARGMNRFASHSVGCAIYQRSWVNGEPPCTCGFDDASEALWVCLSQYEDKT